MSRAEYSKPFRRRKGGADLSPPSTPESLLLSSNLQALKPRLTLFLPSHQRFGESFSTIPALMPVLSAASYASQGPPGRVAEPFDQRLDTVHFGQTRLDVAQPAEVLLGGVVAQRSLRILQFSK